MLDPIGFDAMKARTARALLACCKVLMAVGLLAGCKGADNPSPVESKNGYSYIPIDGTAFLIPEKSWLKGYANNATDGSICCIMLHATIPDVQPWSPERNEEMYPKEGIQRNLSITIWGNRKSWQAYYKKSHEERWKGYVEEPSDQAGIGLRRYRELWSVYNEKMRKRILESMGRIL